MGQISPLLGVAYSTRWLRWLDLRRGTYGNPTEPLTIMINALSHWMVDISFDGITMCTPVYIKLDAQEQLLLSEGVCQQLKIINYHPNVEPRKHKYNNTYSSDEDKTAPTSPKGNPRVKERADIQNMLTDYTDGLIEKAVAMVPTVRVALIQLTHL